MVVMSGDVGRWCGLSGTLVGVSVLRVMWLELEKCFGDQFSTVVVSV